jgi:hypothetical protein
MTLEKELTDETLKWLKKIEDKLRNLKASDDDYLKNIRAYILDSKYFLERKDLIRAFECVVWAWAWLEIGEIEGKLKFLE